MFKSFDVYTKADSMVQQKTTTGALITLVSSIFMFFLFISEYGAYKEIRVADHMTIDPAYGEQIISANLSMSFLKLKCKNVNIDIDDRSGHHDIHVDNNMEKIPYVHPIDKAIEPQKYLTQELLNKNAPGCSISGTFKLRKVAGNFHIALGKNLMASQKGVTHTSNTPKYQFSFKDIAHFNTSHIIHHLDFGRLDDVVGNKKKSALSNSNNQVNDGIYPLDNTTKMLPNNAKTAQYQYFIKVVATEYEPLYGKKKYSNQFSFTEHVRLVTQANGIFMGGFPHPGVFFKYDFSPIMVQFTEERKSFMEFLTSACAIIGGVFTCAGLVTRCCIGTADVIAKLD